MAYQPPGGGGGGGYGGQPPAYYGGGRGAGGTDPSEPPPTTGQPPYGGGAQYQPPASYIPSGYAVGGGGGGGGTAPPYYAGPTGQAPPVYGSGVGGGAPPSTTGQPPYGGGGQYQPPASYIPSGYAVGGGGGAPPTTGTGYPSYPGGGYGGYGGYGGAPMGGAPMGGYPSGMGGGPMGGAPMGGYPMGGAPMGGSMGGAPMGGPTYGGAPTYQGGYPSAIPATSGYPSSSSFTRTTTVTTTSRPLAFFNHVAGLVQRDYILIVDKSGSMAGSLWREAEKAVGILAPNICRCDPDGITLYFFSSKGSYPKYENLRDAGQVAAAFRSQKPGGSTCLHGVLHVAFEEHFRKGGSPTTILVITDGEPDNKSAVEDEIRRAANRIRQDSELSVSFIQIGRDAGAKRWLQKLDDDIRGARFDIVDSLTADEMAGMSFEDFIYKSIND
jgi:hypothetical protein